MASRRLLLLAARTTVPRLQPFSHSSRVFVDPKERLHENVEQHRSHQKEKPLNPHMTNTSSTITNKMPNIGKASAPPDMLSSVDGKFAPKDDSPEHTQRMTGGTQKAGAGVDGDAELNVGELEGASFRVEPLRRTGEDVGTMRARLLYQSRKRGTLESELLMSTFASANLASMSKEQLGEYDIFLDENDWDIYYWATQEPTPTSLETAEGAVDTKPAVDIPVQSPRPGEWAQTVGTFKPAYRPVPQRWKKSEILARLREHVKSRSNEGMAFMPPITHFN